MPNSASPNVTEKSSQFIFQSSKVPNQIITFTIFHLCICIEILQSVSTGLNKINYINYIKYLIMYIYQIGGAEHNNRDVFSCKTCIRDVGKVPSTKRHQCFLVSFRVQHVSACVGKTPKHRGGVQHASVVWTLERR